MKGGKSMNIEDINEQQMNQASEEVQRREFLEKFGKLAAAVPVGMLVLMGPTQSRAAVSINGGDTGGGSPPPTAP